jgi:uracil-DNA glycosylase
MAKSKKARRLDELAAQIRVCTRCPLHESRTHAVPGDGKYTSRVMIIGEAPGREEDETGKPFVGSAGRYLDHVLEGTKLDRRDFFITNTVKCFISPRVVIFTTEGYKPIKDVQVGELVLTHEGRFRRVDYIRPREVLPEGSEVVQLTLRSTDRADARPLKMTVTPEHPFLINGEWKPAHAIQVGDGARTLGDRCEVCGRAYFVRYDRYGCRTYRTCSYRCHNLRIYHNPDAREKVRRTLREQYADGRRDPLVITRRAHERVRELVAAGAAKIQHLTPEERHRGRVAIAANVTGGRGAVRNIGFGEQELKPILERLGVDYIHRFAFPDSSFLYDFCLPEQQILIEVRGPGAQNESYQSRMMMKDELAKEHGHLVLNLWWAQVLEQPDMVEALLGRLLKNHAGEYTFVDVEVTEVERRRTRRAFPLYNIGVEEDESYVATGIVSHNCRPPKNRTPKAIETGTCESNYLFEQIELIDPKLVMLLGSVAAKTVLGVKSVNEARGRVVEHEGRRFIVGYHPAVRFYREDLGEKVKEDFALLKRELRKL